MIHHTFTIKVTQVDGEDTLKTGLQHQALDAKMNLSEYLEPILKAVEEARRLSLATKEQINKVE